MSADTSGFHRSSIRPSAPPRGAGAPFGIEAASMGGRGRRRVRRGAASEHRSSREVALVYRGQHCFGRGLQKGLPTCSRSSAFARILFLQKEFTKMATKKSGYRPASTRPRAAVPKLASSEKPVALTVKVTHELYVRLRTLAAIRRRTNQDILNEALQQYLDRIDK